VETVIYISEGHLFSDLLLCCVAYLVLSQNSEYATVENELKYLERRTVFSHVRVCLCYRLARK
jgi:hypothetical protein